MKTETEWYSFEMPERWKGLVGARIKEIRTDLVLLWEKGSGCSGLLVSLKCLKRRKQKPDEYTEYLGRLTGRDGDRRFLYAAYGREGAVSEENEDLYWRLRDQLWMVLESLAPADGCRLEKQGE